MLITKSRRKSRLRTIMLTSVSYTHLMILGAEDKLFSLEYDLFADVRDQIGREVLRIQKTARAIARLDVYASLSLIHI